MSLLTPKIREALLENGRANQRNENLDPYPVVRLFLPDGKATWLLTEMDPDDQDTLYGLCDPGDGTPALGIVGLADVQAIRGPLGLAVEHDPGFRAERPLSAYVRDAGDRA